jgi:3',5'-cyclic AMP phosphodiesterase CpdA
MRNVCYILFFGLLFAQKTNILDTDLEPFDSKPYITPTTSPTNSVTINWNTVSQESTIVAYGVTSSLEDTARLAGLYYYHHIQLTGLLPATEYFYQVVPWGDMKQFTTFPAQADSFTFIAFGNTRSDSVAHQSVINRMAVCEFDFFMHSGDLVNDGGNTSDWRKFFNIEDTLLQSKHILPTIGDHESPYWPYDTLFSLPDSEEYYSVNYGNAHFIMLNTEMDLYGAQRDWLINDLTAASSDTLIDWIFVNLHRSPYSSGNHGSQMDVRNAWCPLFEEYGVDIVFCGHDHDYERTLKISGVVYIVTGGGGAPLYNVGSSGWTAYSEMTYHFCLIRIMGTKLILKPIKPDGVVFDSLILHKGPRIIDPIISCPKIVEKDELFNVEIVYPKYFTIPTFTISSEFDTYMLNISNYSSTDSSYIFDVTCPTNVESSLYDLIIEFPGYVDTSYNSISIVSEYKIDFKFIHVTDPHIGHGANDTLIEKVIQDANFINPDLLIITGDIGDDGTRRQYCDFLESLKKSRVPLFVISGNHDYYPDDSIRGFTEYVNSRRDFSFDYGDCHFTALDTHGDNGFPLYRCYGFTPEQLALCEEDLIAHQSSRIRFALCHGPIYDELNPNIYGTTEFVNLCQNYDVRMIFQGHTHYDKVFDQYGNRQGGDIQPLSGPIFVQTATCTKYQWPIVTNLTYRLMRVVNDDVYTYTVDRNENGVRDAESALLVEDLILLYNYSSDSSICSTTVYNNHNEYFKNCLLLFNMTYGILYDCAGGVIIRQQDGLVEVVVDSVGPKSTNVVIVFPETGVEERLASHCKGLHFSPNPFSDNLIIKFSISETQRVQLKFYDCLGRQIEIVLDSFLKPGNHTIPWNCVDESGDAIPAGIYFLIFKNNKNMIKKKLVKVR